MSQTLYFGGPIVTMERELYVQALLTEGERILYAGSLHGAEERAEGTVRRVDLKGRALLPDRLCQHLPPGRPGGVRQLGGSGAAAVRLRGKREPGPGRMGPGRGLRPQ